jgi:hypothetical protein
VLFVEGHGGWWVASTALVVAGRSQRGLYRGGAGRVEIGKTEYTLQFAEERARIRLLAKAVAENTVVWRGEEVIPMLYFTWAVRATVLAALVSSLRIDPAITEGDSDISVNNSHIVIRTDRITRIVGVGPEALTPLVCEMRRRDVALDTFARCYSACDQILEKAGLKEPVRWYGGLVTFEKQHDRVVDVSRTDGFSEKFRRMQVAEIVGRAKELGIVVGNPP